MITFEQLLLEVSLEQLKQQWVDSGKISKECYDFCLKVTEGLPSAYTTFFVKKFTQMVPDFKKFSEVFNLDDATNNLHRLFVKYLKYKKYYLYQDINTYTTLPAWIIDSNRVDNVIATELAKETGKGVNKFKIGTVEADGKEYEVYKLPKGHVENKPVAVALGRHSERCKGWCTSYDGNLGYWERHIAQEDLYIFINPKDRLNDKYQIQFGYFGSRPFSIEKDIPVAGKEELKKFVPFYEFLKEKEGRSIPAAVEQVIEQ